MELHVIFRMPKFPVIIGRGDALFSANSPQSLVNVVAMEIQDVKDENIVFIDATGEEFLYHDDSKSLMPSMMRNRGFGWVGKRRGEKRIIPAG